MDDRALRSPRRSCFDPACVLTLLVACFLTAAGPASQPARAQGESVKPVQVELDRPGSAKGKRRSGKSEWTRGRSEGRRGDAGDIDPRFLEYRRLLAEIASAKDSVTVAYDARERADLFASVTEMAQLERELDQMERLLDTQRERLRLLQADFAGRQRTELDLLVTGGTLAGQVDSVRVTLEDGTAVTSLLTETQRASMQHGGVLEVFRGLVEPRPQVIEIALMGEGWSSTGHGFITLEPARDRLTFLKLDLSQAKPVLGIGSVVAGTWQLDPGVPAAEAIRDRP